MPIEVDFNFSLIRVTSPDTSVSAQELHDTIEDAMASAVGVGNEDILLPEGKIEDPNNPGVYSQIILTLYSPWQIQYWAGSGYTRIYGGKIVGGLNNQPMKATGTAGDITVLESPVDGVTVVSGSGVTEQDKLDIAEEVWDEDRALIVRKILENKVTKVGDIITIYQDDGITVWRQYNLASGGRVLV